MKKIFIMLVLLLLSFATAASANFEENEENYKKYYQGYHSYPISFVQWGKGYVLDLYSVRALTSKNNVLLGDVHIVNLETDIMEPDPLHLYAEYDRAAQSFVIGLQNSAGNQLPKELTGYTREDISAHTMRTNFQFPAGLMMWESHYREPFLQGHITLPPVPEPGCPLDIKVREDTSYSRTGYNSAEICMHKPTGVEFYSIVFEPQGFVVKAVSAQESHLQEKLQQEVGVMQYYEHNPRVDLVRRYLGIARN